MYANSVISDAILSKLHAHHEEIMVFGFLATLIVTERYVGSLAINPPRITHSMPFLVATELCLNF